MIASGAINKTTVATTASTLATRAATCLYCSAAWLAALKLPTTFSNTNETPVIAKPTHAASQAAEQYKQKQEQTKQAIASMSNGEINSLINSYDKLQQKSYIFIFFSFRCIKRTTRIHFLL
jgi:hypothetical protein